MVSLWPIIGAGLLGFGVGFATGMSNTDGTTKRAIGVIGALAGGSGIVGWTQGVGQISVPTQGTEQVGILISVLSVGFIIGLLVGMSVRNEEERRVLHSEGPPR
jgi:hypothetical protein